MTLESNELPNSAVVALSQGNKIEAIKLLRAEKGMGLKEAKDSVENYLRHHPEINMQYESVQAESKGGFLRALIFFVAILGLFLWFASRK